MTITKERLVMFLIRMVEERDWHQDFEKLNQKKLEMIKRILKLEEEEIKVKNGIVYLETKRKEISKGLGLEEKEVIKEINEKFNIYIKEYLKYEKRTFEKMNGIREELYIFHVTDYKTRERVINSHREQILKEIRMMLENLIEILYEIDFRKIGEEITLEEYKEKQVKFNIELSKEEEEIMNNRLSKTDYGL